MYIHQMHDSLIFKVGQRPPTDASTEHAGYMHYLYEPQTSPLRHPQTSPLTAWSMPATGRTPTQARTQSFWSDGHACSSYHHSFTTKDTVKQTSGASSKDAPCILIISPSVSPSGWLHEALALSKFRMSRPAYIRHGLLSRASCARHAFGPAEAHPRQLQLGGVRLSAGWKTLRRRTG